MSASGSAQVADVTMPPVPQDSAADAAVLRGTGFVLRPWRAGDLDALVRHADDAQVARGLGARFPVPYTRADGAAFLAGHVVEGDGLQRAIEIDGEACGGIGLRPGRGERRCGASLGYWLGRAHWNRGVMRAVVAAYAPWAMRQLRLARLEATVFDDNPASARVLLANGFAEEGRMRRAVVDRDGLLHDLRLFARIEDSNGIRPDE